MKNILTILVLLLVITISSCNDNDPYREGAHWDYSIICEGGFVYKSFSHRGTILVLNSDGTPLRCGKKRY